MSELPLILGHCSGRTVGRTAVYFIRKLLRVGCRLRFREEEAKPGGFAYAGEGHARERGVFVGRVGESPSFCSVLPGKAVASVTAGGQPQTY